MSLVQVNKQTVARATLLQQVTYELEWRPEQDVAVGGQVELRTHNLRSFLSWGFRSAEVDLGEITYRWKVNPEMTAAWNNKTRLLVRVQLPNGIRQGEPIRIRLTLLPPLWAGVDLTLQAWSGATHEDCALQRNGGLIYASPVFIEIAK